VQAACEPGYTSDQFLLINICWFWKYLFSEYMSSNVFLTTVLPFPAVCRGRVYYCTLLPLLKKEEVMFLLLLICQFVCGQDYRVLKKLWTDFSLNLVDRWGMAEA